MEQQNVKLRLDLLLYRKMPVAYENYRIWVFAADINNYNYISG